MTLYVREKYKRLTDQAVFDFLLENSLALLISCSADGPSLSHLPFLIDGTPESIGPIRGHLAKENPHYKVLLRDPQCTLVFSGANAYMSPKWYRPPFASTGEKAAVPRFPTWNYVVVHIKGRTRFLDNVAEIDRVLDDSVRQFEERYGTNWDPASYPLDRRKTMREAIAAFEVTVDEVVPKFKLNQYHQPEEIMGAVLGLYSRDDPSSRSIARYMHEALQRESQRDV